jgi:hypothetical protein
MVTKEEKILLEKEEDLNTNLDILKELLDLHYSGKIDIENFYKVGDIIPNIPLRNKELNEDVDLVVVGINHDTIANSNGVKAALTLGQVECLSNPMKMSYSDLSYINGKYSMSYVRSYLSTIYYNALPITLRDLIKTVNKNTCEPQSDDDEVSTIIYSTETCFIPSHDEIVDCNDDSLFHYCPIDDGVQYEYYKTMKNYKTPWWLRSGFRLLNNEGIPFMDMSCFSCVERNGGLYYHSADLKNIGVRPHFCL